MKKKWGNSLAKNEGKQFEVDLSNSCKSLNIFYDRIKDTFLPPEVRSRVPVSKNKYDFYIFDQQHLFATELKSTKQKSFSFDEKIIKQHQIDALLDATEYPHIIAGFIFNFREPENKTYFIHIHDFIKYKGIAQADSAVHSYKSKINKSSIPISICEEIGIKIKNYKKKVHYHYHVKDFIGDAIERYK